MRTVFFTLGSGAGNLMIGASLFNALRRAGLNTDFTIISDSEFIGPFKTMFSGVKGGIFRSVTIKPEPEKLFRDDLNTELFNSLLDVNPELIIVFKNWMPIMPLLEEFSCPKVLLLRECPDKWLNIRIGEHDTIEVNAGEYDLAFSIEPEFLPKGFEQLPPFVLKNTDELPSKGEARTALEIQPGRKCCIIAHNGRRGEFEQLLKTDHSPKSLSTEDLSDYQIVKTTSRQNGDSSLFPLIDYLPAADFVIGGGGYNLFYECRYLDIPGLFYPFERSAENQKWRIDNNSAYSFTVNGADLLVKRILDVS